jgi:hypothetical protein
MARHSWLILLIGACLVLDSVQALSAPEPKCPGGSNPDPNWVFCEGFDNPPSGGWGHSDYYAPTYRWIQCDNNAFGFQSPCAGWTGYPWGFDGVFGYDGNGGRKQFSTTGLTDFYVRWYDYISNPFVPGKVGNKSVLINEDANTYQLDPYILVSKWGTMKPSMEVYNDGITGDRPQNLGNDITLTPGRWYLFEWHIKLNTPGVQNGISELWINDASAGPITAQTKRMHYTNVRYLLSGQNLKAKWIWLSGYSQTYPDSPPPKTQHKKWSQIVISKARIGPMGGQGKDTVPPNPPINLFAR